MNIVQQKYNVVNANTCYEIKRNVILYGLDKYEAIL